MLLRKGFAGDIPSLDSASFCRERVTSNPGFRIQVGTLCDRDYRAFGYQRLPGRRPPLHRLGKHALEPSASAGSTGARAGWKKWKIVVQWVSGNLGCLVVLMSQRRRAGRQTITNSTYTELVTFADGKFRHQFFVSAPLAVLLNSTPCFLISCHTASQFSSPLSVMNGGLSSLAWNTPRFSSLHEYPVIVGLSVFRLLFPP